LEDKEKEQNDKVIKASEEISEGKKEKEKKDGWDKAAIILRPVGGLIAALAVSIIGFIGSNYLADSQRAELDSQAQTKKFEARIHLYSELMSKREQAESALRKDMFKSIIDTFLKPGSAEIDTKVLNLELLIYNFHESLNLKPLFIHLKREVGNDEGYLGRLEKAAREVSMKQMTVLGGFGEAFDLTVDLTSLKFIFPGKPSAKGDTEENYKEDFVKNDLTVEGIKRTFIIGLLGFSKEERELDVSLEVITPNKSTKVVNRVKASFLVGFYDFPMIDNTRLSNDQRCAVVLNGWSKSTVDLTLIYFPGAYASLKEKPYYQEVIQNLLKLDGPISTE